MSNSKTKIERHLLSLLIPAAIVVGLISGCGGNEPESETEPDVDEVRIEETVSEPEPDTGAKGFEESALDFFLEISKIPRESNNEQAISDWLVTFAAERGLEAVQDEALNVFIRKPGSAGRESEPPVILQAHIDMVCEKNDGVNHDFLKDPIIPIIESGRIYADGTTLGADDGAGVAMILAVLDAGDISHPPVEALFTTNEEDGMTGAAAFDASLFSGRRLINLDAEDEGVFYVSSAAATDVDITITVETAPLPEGLVSYTLAIHGLAGGHSGVDIDKGHANANILMARLLYELPSYYLSSIDGGSARNAIPRECTAVISLSAEDADGVQAIISDMEAVYKRDYPSDSGLSISLEQTGAPQSNIIAGGRAVLDTILEIPSGVISMSPAIDGLVQTSNNVGVVETDGSIVTILCYPRSSEPSEQIQTVDTIREIAGRVNAEVLANDVTPAWPYKADSPLRELLISIFVEMYGQEPSPEAVHAGLECGTFAGEIPDMDIISIGPDISGAHSPDEEMSLESFNRVCDFLIKVLEQL